MHDWKTVKDGKRSRASRTPGIQKGPHCQASPLKKYLAKHERSYKHKDYHRWNEIFMVNIKNT